MTKEVIVQLYVKVVMQLEEGQDIDDVINDLSYDFEIPEDMLGEVTDTYIDDYEIVKQ